MNKPGRFDDLADDLPWNKPADEKSAGLNDELAPYADVLKRMDENKRKNTNRKYKPQKGRMKLLVCMSCDWKCRTTRAMIDAGIPNCPRKTCFSYGKPLTLISIAHTDHPLRHFDQTCPACVAEAPVKRK